MLRSAWLLSAVALLTLGGTLPAVAKVIAEGKPSGGYYWQKVEHPKGPRYLCRSTSEGKLQKHANCEAAGAVKPE